MDLGWGGSESPYEEFKLLGWGGCGGVGVGLSPTYEDFKIMGRGVVRRGGVGGDGSGSDV